MRREKAEKIVVRSRKVCLRCVLLGRLKEFLMAVYIIKQKKSIINSLSMFILLAKKGGNGVVLF